MELGLESMEPKYMLQTEKKKQGTISQFVEAYWANSGKADEHTTKLCIIAHFTWNFSVRFSVDTFGRLGSTAI